METIKKTITREEITGYKAFDGTVFRDAEECRKYESSAEASATLAAWHYLVDERWDYDIFGNEEEHVLLFDCRDVEAYEIIHHWATLCGVYELKDFTPDYIGKRIAFFVDWDGHPAFNTYYATKDALLDLYTRHINALFADKETK